MMNQSPLQTLSGLSKYPEYDCQSIQSLIRELGVDERVFALLMNVSPSTVRQWLAGETWPNGAAQRLMQLYHTCPGVIDRLAEACSECGEDEANW